MFSCLWSCFLKDMDCRAVFIWIKPSSLRLVEAKVIANRWLDGSWPVFHREAGDVLCKLFELPLKKAGSMGSHFHAVKGPT